MTASQQCLDRLQEAQAQYAPNASSVQRQDPLGPCGSQMLAQGRRLAGHGGEVRCRFPIVMLGWGGGVGSPLSGSRLHNVLRNPRRT